MEQPLYWPIAARATVSDEGGRPWRLTAYASGPDLRYNGDFQSFTPEQVQQLIDTLPAAAQMYSEILGSLPRGVQHTAYLPGVRVEIGGYNRGLCIAPHSRWAAKFTLQTSEVAAMLGALREAQRIGEGFQGLASRISAITRAAREAAATSAAREAAAPIPRVWDLTGGGS